jgi:hypothetical protein
VGRGNARFDLVRLFTLKGIGLGVATGIIVPLGSFARGGRRGKIERGSWIGRKGANIGSWCMTR